MTLAEFYALQASPEAIIVPRHGAPSRRLAPPPAAVRRDAQSTVSAATPGKAGADKKH